MIESALRGFIEYKWRTHAVIILTLLVGLAALWPAADEYTAARQRTTAAHLKLAETRQEIEKLPGYMELHKQKLAELESLERRMVPERAAQELQGELTELGRQTGCTLRRAAVQPSSSRDWCEKDDPLEVNRPKTQSEETPFRLETRVLSLSVTGPMNGLYKFLSRLNQVDRVVHSRAITLRRSSEDGSMAALDVELLLFDLPLKPAKS